MNKELAQYLTVLISNDIDKKLPEGAMGISSLECEKIEDALASTSSTMSRNISKVK